MYTGVVTTPCCAMLEETLFSFPKPSRGTPRPAESLRKTKVSGVVSLEGASGLALTGTRVGRETQE